MGEEILEKVAQLQHENIKLLNELNHLKEHFLYVEETLNVKCSELSGEKKRTESLQQQNEHVLELIKEKDQLIESLEQEKANFKQLHTKLSSEILSLKGELLQERLKNKQLEILKTAEEDLKNSIAKIKEENQRLISEISFKSEECLSKAATIKELGIQIEEIENEKVELLAMRDTLLREKEERLRSTENLENILKKSPLWQKSTLVPFGQELVTASFSRDTINSNLREEFLEAEIQEKQNQIDQLKNVIQKKEEEELERSKSITELKEALSNVGLLNYDFNVDLRLDSSALYYIYDHLLKVINWPEGHSTECKPLTDVPAALSVIIKDGVQTTQPTSVRIIETISIASQTDPIKNLSPVLPLKTFEKLQSNVSQSRSDSDDEGEEPSPLSFIEKDKTSKGMQLFSEPKNCDLDMDMYRSCRKLSVLPEEDESFNRKSSLKKSHNANSFTFNLKTHSADDVTKIQTVKPLKKATSCSNVTPKTRKQTNGFETHSRKRSGNGTNEDSEPGDKKDSDLLLPILSPKDAFRQPHSFDSYLDPLKARNLPLPRQTSDPTQNSVFAPPITRRGSYIKKPRSTCRPLTLPCEKGDRKKEERICKVRFDLNGVLPRDNDATKKETNSLVLSNAKKIKMVSRFRVEIVDEIEFRKSLEENERNAVVRKRPPLIHSVIYKKSVLRDLTNFTDKNERTERKFSTESPESPVYDTATEGSPAESFDIDISGSCYINDYPVKRRKQSDASSYSFEDSQSSSEGNDIFIKSIKLHSNSKCIIMKELQKENSDTSFSSTESEIPFIDAEDLPVIKPSPEIMKIIPIPEILLSEKPNITISSPGSGSEGSDAYLTPCDATPLLENSETSTFGAPKSSGLSKSPTVLKNLANFEFLATISESRKLSQNEIIKEEEEKDADCKSALKRTPSDMSEASECDTLTYGTVKSQVVISSDGDSDTYVSVWSDKSFTLERKFSDLSENSSSPYNTPPDTSSASFCTPPDTYSPILSTFKKYSDVTQGSFDNKREEFSDSLPTAFDVSPSFHSQRNFGPDNSFYKKKPTKPKTTDVIFDSPKLEFYETNDSVENLEAFLQTEEGLTELQGEAPEEPETFFENEDFRETLQSKRNSLESPKPLERRKKYPPLSRQNSTEEYNFLDPHDSCLNLSEEISSPSTTPDTSNKTVIFKNVPLTVSNTIDLDDDFLISETEIQVNFNGSQPEIVQMLQTGEPVIRYAKNGHCLSEPCTPSISSADFLEFSVPRKQRSSFTEESLTREKFESNLPEIIVSRLSSESDDSEVPGCAETDFASNVSDRSEVHLSDVNSISGHSDNCGSFSEHSDNVISDVFSSDSDKSSGISPEITQDSSSSPPSEKQAKVENSEKPAPNVLGDEFHTHVEEDVRGTEDVKEVP